MLEVKTQGLENRPTGNRFRQYIVAIPPQEIELLRCLVAQERQLARSKAARMSSFGEADLAQISLCLLPQTGNILLNSLHLRQLKQLLKSAGFIQLIYPAPLFVPLSRAQVLELFDKLTNRLEYGAVRVIENLSEEHDT